MTFAERVRAARKVAGITQRQAAEFAGITGQTMWCQMEYERWQPDRTYKKLHKRIEDNTLSGVKLRLTKERLDLARARLEAIAKAVNSTVEFLVDGPAAECSPENDVTIPPQQIS